MSSHGNYSEMSNGELSDGMEAHLHRMRALMMSEYQRREEEDQPNHERKYVNRDRVEGHLRLMKDYFNPNPTYDALMFRRRYRMQPCLFARIMNEVISHDPYFRLKIDAANKISLSPQQKLTSSLRMLANGCSADSVDEYCRMGESTSLECLRRFCKAILSIYGNWYLRQPNENDLKRLLDKANKRGFPGMIGSIDCMHWQWRNCPTGHVGQYTGFKGKPTIVLEAVASYDTWIWHAFFGTSGSNNDLNTLGCSPVFDKVVNGEALTVRFKVNGRNYNQCYYLADGIYPSWATFVKSINNPDSPEKALFTQLQEAHRKDVERAFGILQTKWAIVRGPARIWDTQTLGEIMLTCIVLHNMIIEDEYMEDEDGEVISVAHDYEISPNASFEFGRDRPTIEEYMRNHNRIHNVDTHHSIRNDLVKHIWTLYGSHTV